MVTVPEVMLAERSRSFLRLQKGESQNRCTKSPNSDGEASANDSAQGTVTTDVESNSSI
ncbi:MAG: hypothetical protein VKL39_01530 [Leptolyngbyaceae bacterium]|nr:hypothetical protein [Leptolyngbyaceae bacterium]